MQVKMVLDQIDDYCLPSYQAATGINTVILWKHVAGVQYHVKTGNVYVMTNGTVLNYDGEVGRQVWEHWLDMIQRRAL